jgi:hypothetical protein
MSVYYVKRDYLWTDLFVTIPSNILHSAVHHYYRYVGCWIAKEWNRLDYIIVDKVAWNLNCFARLPLIKE